MAIKNDYFVAIDVAEANEVNNFKMHPPVENCMILGGGVGVVIRIFRLLLASMLQRPLKILFEVCK